MQFFYCDSINFPKCLGHDPETSTTLVRLRTKPSPAQWITPQLPHLLLAASRPVPGVIHRPDLGLRLPLNLHRLDLWAKHRLTSSANRDPLTALYCALFTTLHYNIISVSIIRAPQTILKVLQKAVFCWFFSCTKRSFISTYLLHLGKSVCKHQKLFLGVS